MNTTAKLSSGVIDTWNLILALYQVSHEPTRAELEQLSRYSAASITRHTNCLVGLGFIERRIVSTPIGRETRYRVKRRQPPVDTREGMRPSWRA